MYDTTSSTPPQKRVSSHYITNAIFSSVYICEKPTSLAYQEKKQLQDKPIIAWKKKNLGKCKHKVYFQQKARVNANMRLVFLTVEIF